MTRSVLSRDVASDNSLICVGELRSPYGIKGWLWVYSYTDPIEQVFSYAPWLIVEQRTVKQSSPDARSNFQDKSSSKLDERNTLLVQNWRKQGKGLIVQLKGVDNRTAAEQLVNTSLYIESTALPTLADNEFYWSELIGMRVMSDTGDILGVVETLSETPAHQMLEVSPNAESVDDESRLIPWHETIVVDVDRNQKIITVAWQADF